MYRLFKLPKKLCYFRESAWDIGGCLLMLSKRTVAVDPLGSGDGSGSSMDWACFSASC